ncbi:hypothetical protein BTA51_15360 [Hahella sp. CCB-MM4]|uniref:DUF1631 domain-containing protein n=1 Tax=Hahella sp. (strain CCB-MM4) TaxID=1926491 RepID=UPI000B9B962D|nr:DUF1631 domain-containing protein [Hahella sp. CCB-MM4]OZG72498.1 hypothetical protein BTA51_15360 [Hahella sp. CCB-MM4]
MSQGSKVVQLDSHRADQSAAKGVKLPAPLVKLRDRCGEHLRKLMVRLFDQMDDTYFDLADQATSNAQQSSYFDAMRELRLKKNRVTALFIQGFTRDFQFRDSGNGKPAAKKPLDLENLSLVKDDALEEQVAVDNMVNRFQSEAGRELEHLTLRMDALMLNVDVEDQSNPLGPARITKNFAAACQDLEMDIKAKLVFFKLFEKHVLGHVKSMLEASNKYLIEQGVIPDMSVVRPVPVPRYQGPARQTLDRRGSARDTYMPADASDGYLSDAYEEVGLSDGVTVDPLQLMSQSARRPAGNASVQLPLLQQNTLVSLLSTAQHNNSNLPVISNGLVDYARLLEHMVRNDQGQARARVGDTHQDVMNLVNMLFEYILSDQQLQSSVKALIARLQIPIVKVALLDKTFFNRGGHPARRLLNELATAAIGWTEKADGGNDPFLNKLEEVVLRLLNEFESDLSIFDDIMQDFQSFQEGEKKRRQLVEQRTRDSEVGKAKSEAAKKEVQAVLNQHLEGAAISELALEILKEGWSSYMVLLHLKYGITHDDWNDALATVDNLINATNLNGEAEPLDMDAVEGLLGKLKEGLAQTAFKPFDLDKCLQKLEADIVDTAQKRLAAEVEFEEEYSFDSEQEDFESAVLGGLDVVDLDEVAENLDTLEEEQEVETVAQAIPESTVEQSEPVAAQDLASQALQQQKAPQQQEPTAANVDEPVAKAGKIVLVEEVAEAEVEDTPDEKSLQMVDRIKIGSWVEVNEGEDKKYRCKLAAIIPTTGKYIFVNRMGVKVMEKSRLGLAMALKTHTMSMLDDGLLFDRALESVIGNLRSNKSQKQEA